jgi:VWFA-related protein
MSLRRASSVLAVVSALGLGTSLHSQTPVDPDQVPVLPSAPRVQFESKTVLIPIDVRVVDKSGRPITDLKESEFVVLEDGQPQAIQHFATLRFSPEVAEVHPAGRPPRAADAFETSSPNRRTFLILLGRGALQEPSKGVDAMLHLVRERAMPQDYIAVMAWNRASDFTTDRTKVADILERFKRAHLGIEQSYQLWQTSLARIYGDGRVPEGLQARIDAVFGGARADGVRTMDADSETVRGVDTQLRQFADAALGGGNTLTRMQEWRLAQFGSLDDMLRRDSQNFDDMYSLFMAVEHMRQIAGQKQVLFVSEYGFTYDDVDLVKMIGRRASDARVSMNMIHAGGMPPSGLFDASSREPTSVGQAPLLAITTGQDARTISSLSGGRFFGHKSSNSSGDVDLIDQGSRFQYTLAYYPAKDPVDGRYRQIRVRVTRPGAQVIARDGYYARANVGPAEIRSAVVLSRVKGVAERPFDVPDIGLTKVSAVRASSKTPDVTVSMTIDLSRVYFEKSGTENVASLDVAVFGLTGRHRKAGQAWKNLALRYSDERLAELKRTGLYHEVTLAPTPMTTPAEIKVVVYDYSSDLLGSAVAKVGK